MKNTTYWSDGIHYVKPAARTVSDKDRWPWRVGSHAHSASKYRRKAATMDEAISMGKEASKLWLKLHPDERAFHNTALLPLASSLPGKRKRPIGRPPKPAKLPYFSTYHFNCISANPVAQVWMCMSIPGERKNVGRKARGGKPNQQAAFNHTKGQCAVLLWKEPLRNPDGTVRVLNRMEAEHLALDLFFNTPEDDRLFWEEGHKVVHRTHHVDVIFDPECNSAKEPFSLWVHPPGGDPKPVFGGYRKKSYTKAPGRLLGGGTLMPGNADEAAALELNRKLAAMASEENIELTDKAITFESIWGAEHHAETVTEATLRGERVLLRV